MINEMKKGWLSCLSLVLGVWATQASAAVPFEQCIVNKVISAGNGQTIDDVRQACAELSGVQAPTRLLEEQLTEDSRFVITPHRQNYILPFTHNDRPNQQPWLVQNIYPDIARPVQNKEAKLQISLKVPLTNNDIFTDNDGLYFGFTLKSFWQVYNTDLSAPFRETNYRPEMFYQAPISSHVLGGTVFTRVGFEHESNGRSQLLSRSWNRAYLGLGFLRDNWAFHVQPWYRLPEDEKVDDGDPLTPLPSKGDDNPDIDDYLGHFELLAVYSRDQYELSSITRQNFDSGKGSFELGVSFPISGRIKGYVQFFNGYGESLIDYDHRVQRIGLGILLTDLL